MKFQDLGSCILVDKIASLNTHSPDYGKMGLAEILEEELKTKIYVVHRLDKSTSGAILFAKNPETATALSQQFEQHMVKKTYLFLTDKTISEKQLTRKSHIKKHMGEFVSRANEEINSETRFQWIRSVGNFQLWEANPVTGKPHQIRLHAADAGMPILGDVEHGGSEFFRVCLHALRIEIQIDGAQHSLSTPEPLWAQNIDDLETIIATEAIERREKIYQITEKPDQCFRLIHNELNNYRLDQYGENLWAYWYLDRDPNDGDMIRFMELNQKYKKHIYIRKMLNRGDDPNTQLLWKIGEPKSRWVAHENNLKFELRSDMGQSPGLFLDQRENRKWVQDNAKDKTVLNLFSYTGGFSIAAAMGGAKEVVTVDTSSNFIDWSKENFRLNQLDPDQYEFWITDAQLFLKGTHKRGRKFSMIICDPPSFGRSKEGVFSISKNFKELMMQCLFCLGSGGVLLFSTNYEKWEIADLKKQVDQLKREFSIRVSDTPMAGLDFELPGQSSLMKSLLIYKK